MSVERANEFLKAFLKEKRSDEALTARVAKMGSKEEVDGFLSGVAREMGYADVSAEDIEQAMAAEDERRRARTSAASEGLQALGDDDLEDVAGGFYWYEHEYTYIGGNLEEGKKHTYMRHDGVCRSDFTDDDCYSYDACEWMENVYFGCDGSYHGSPDDCTVSYFCDYVYQEKNH